jgi:hypothetical protein
MPKISFWVAALVLVVATTATPALASGYWNIRLELAGQPADIFVTAGVEQDIPLSISYRMLNTAPGYGSWESPRGPWQPASPSLVILQCQYSPRAVYIGSASISARWGELFPYLQVCSHRAAVIELYSFSDENESLTKLRFISPNLHPVRSGHPPAAEWRRLRPRLSNWATIDSSYTNGNPMPSCS